MRCRRLLFIVVLTTCALSEGSTTSHKVEPATGCKPKPSNDPFVAPGALPSLEARLMTFGQFVGNWRFRSEVYSFDGTVKRGEGTWKFRWIVNGRAIQDVWQLDSNRHGGRATDYKEIGTTIRLYDPKKNNWNVIWVAAVSLTVEQFTATVENGEITLQGRDADGILTQWRFVNIHRNSFEWLARTSLNEGLTWKLEQRMWVFR